MTLVACTCGLEAAPNVVSHVKTKEKDGYTAMQSPSASVGEEHARQP
jgi:ribosomal protein L3